MSIKRISAWAILHPVPPVVLFVVLFFIGTIAFVRLPINLSPDISFPLVQVTVSQPGAAPTEIETQILTKIEGAVASVGNVHKLTSAALEGQALAFIEFQIGTPIDRAVADVRDAVAKVRSDLPEGIQEPVVQRAAPRLHILDGLHELPRRVLGTVAPHRKAPPGTGGPQGLDPVEDRVGDVLLGGEGDLMLA